MTKTRTPLLMGFFMGLMMIVMIHNGGQDIALGFILAHVAVALVAIAAILAAAKWGLPARMTWLTRLHRPKWSHVLPMGGGMLAAGIAACLTCVAGFWGMM